MHPSLLATEHRPWPLPRGRWIWRQSWLDLAYIHYRVEAALLQTKLPLGLKVQNFDGSAWLGLVPFKMDRVARRPFPVVPGLFSFPELNLRTYVESGGKPGVWFFSLDADSWPVVAGGRRIYRLPYYRATMSHRWNSEWIEFKSERRGGAAKFEARYRPISESLFPAAGTFENWMAERYCLYAGDAAGGLRRVEVHHAPWPLQQAEVKIATNDLLSAAGFESLADSPVCHFSSGVDVVSFPAKAVGGSEGAEMEEAMVVR